MRVQIHAHRDRTLPFRQIHTHGSYMEEKGTAMLWHYEDADPEFGATQARNTTLVIRVMTITFLVVRTSLPSRSADASMLVACKGPEWHCFANVI